MIAGIGVVSAIVAVVCLVLGVACIACAVVCLCMISARADADMARTRRHPEDGA